MSTRSILVDLAVLSATGTVWLVVPWHLEATGAPYAKVAQASAVLMPLVLAVAAAWCFVLRGRLGLGARGGGGVAGGRLLFFGFAGFFASLIDDNPVNFDSVFTWPEVTSGLQHDLLEVLLHLLTLGLLYLAVRSALAGTRARGRTMAWISLLLLGSFWASYAQNTPLDAVQALVVANWYYLDAVEHVVALGLFLLAIRVALGARRSP